DQAQPDHGQQEERQPSQEAEIRLLRVQLPDSPFEQLPFQVGHESSLGPAWPKPFSDSFNFWTALNIRDFTVPTGMPRISEISAYLNPLYSDSRSTSRSPSGSASTARWTAERISRRLRSLAGSDRVSASIDSSAFSRRRAASFRNRLWAILKM